MNGMVYAISRAALAVAAGMAGLLSFAGEARAQFTGPGVYVIRIRGTLNVLDVDSTWGNGGRPGQPLLRWGSNDGSNQKFIVLSAPGGGFVIRAVHSLQCLEVPSSNTAIGVEIVQRPCNGGVNQRFTIPDAVPLGTARAFIRTVLADRVLSARREGGRVVLASPDYAEPAPGTVFYFLRI